MLYILNQTSPRTGCLGPQSHEECLVSPTDALQSVMGSKEESERERLLVCHGLPMHSSQDEAGAPHLHSSGCQGLVQVW